MLPNIEILDSVNRLIPDRYRSIIIDEFNKILSNPKINKGSSNITIKHMFIHFYNRNDLQCNIEDAIRIGMAVKFDSDVRLHDGHFGIQIYLPNKIRRHRNKILDSLIK